MFSPRLRNIVARIPFGAATSQANGDAGDLCRPGIQAAFLAPPRQLTAG